MSKKIVYLLAAFISASNIGAQNKPEDINSKAHFFEKKLSVIYDKMHKSTVSIRTKGTGVVVSEDGYILTASHLIDGLKKLGDSIYTTVELYNGQKLRARILGSDDANDYGLLKILDKGGYTYSKMGSTKTFGKDNICFMLGHPMGQKKNRPAVLRIGFYQFDNTLGQMQTSCIMMPGDSGGPLFDINGDVIGLCSGNGDFIDYNVYSCIDSVNKYWPKLIEETRFNPEQSKKYNLYPPTVTNPENAISKGKEGLKHAFKKFKKNVGTSVVKLKSNVNKKELFVHGTIIHPKGYIVSKSSMIGNENLRCILPDGEIVSAQVKQRVYANDLVIIKVDKSNLKAIDIKSKKDQTIGKFIATVGFGDTILYTGIIGVQPREIPIKSSAIGYLGVHLDDTLMVKMPVEGSPAFNIGIQKGDKIVKLDSTVLRNYADFKSSIRTKKPGQRINIGIKRNGKSLGFTVKLIKNNASWKKYYYKSDVAGHNWSDGFTSAFTHDMPLKYNDVGTPVINLDGEVIGINIARENRPCSFAIPCKEVLKIFANYQTNFYLWLIRFELAAKRNKHL